MPKSTQRSRARLLVRIEGKFFELPAPFSVGITQALDVDAAREASFDSCLHELRSKERKRECQIDLPHGASLALCQLFSVGKPNQDDWPRTERSISYLRYFGLLPRIFCPLPLLRIAFEPLKKVLHYTLAL